jgi:tellurite resistance protein TerC
MYDWSLKKLKRLLVAVIGFTILVRGSAMIMLLGPAFVVIPLASGILATEFAWAARLLYRVRELMEEYLKSKLNIDQEKK